MTEEWSEDQTWIRPIARIDVRVTGELVHWRVAYWPWGGSSFLRVGSWRYRLWLIAAWFRAHTPPSVGFLHR